jgi:hypothetical protein
MKDLITLKEAYSDLVDMPDQLQRIMDQSKEYYPLLNLLLEISRKKYRSDRPSLKEVGMTLGIKQHILSRWIYTIYESLYSTNDDNDVAAIIDLETIVEFEFSHDGRSVCYAVKGISYIPRVGEAVNNSYFSSLLGAAWGDFYVESVAHYIKAGIHCIRVYLKSGSYNLFWHIRKDEAYLKEEIPLWDTLGKTDRELMTLLRISPHFARMDDLSRKIREEKSLETRGYPRKSKS